MSNLNLTPQYDLYVTAKKALIKSLFFYQQNEIELRVEELEPVLSLFEKLFASPNADYGNAYVADRTTNEDRLIFNAEYGVMLTERYMTALAWQSQQFSPAYELLSEVVGLLQERLKPKDLRFGAVSFDPRIMEKTWKFLWSTPMSVLHRLNAMRFRVPVSVSTWRLLNSETRNELTTSELLVSLYDDGFVWPGCPMIFTPTVPTGNDGEKYQVSILPGETQVVNIQFENPQREELVYGIMRELFGHNVAQEIRLDYNSNSFYQALIETIQNQYGGVSGLPAGHILEIIAILYNEFRCISGRRDYDGSNLVSVVSLIHFVNEVRKMEVKQPEDFKISMQFCEPVIMANQPFLHLIRDSFPHPNFWRFN